MEGRVVVTSPSVDAVRRLRSLAPEPTAAGRLLLRFRGVPRSAEPKG